MLPADESDPEPLNVTRHLDRGAARSFLSSSCELGVNLPLRLVYSMDGLGYLRVVNPLPKLPLSLNPLPMWSISHPSLSFLIY